ncbi:Exosome component 10 [Smittium culicis]|uniref:Exosome component 10 n=1 Tax=Smittium culicis TaxID=133412 RepID=A0A1R1Y4M0_9FUNG|nr:Exosome component 10 [Smittium culicis]
MANSTPINLEDAVKNAFSSLMLATKRSNQVSYSDLKFHSTISPEFADILDKTTDKTRNLINSISSSSRNSNFSLQHNLPSNKQKSDLDKIAIKNIQDVLLPPLTQEKKPKYEMGQEYRKIVEIADTIIDRIDVNLDFIKNEKSNPLISGPLSQSKPVVTEYKKVGSKSSNNNQTYNLIHATKIPRPQMKFKDEIDNSNSTNFVWKIKEKPFAKVPLEYGLPGTEIKDHSINKHLEELGLSRSGSSTPIPHSGSDTQFQNLLTFDNNKMVPLPHPYEYEIKSYDPPSRYFSEVETRVSQEWGADSNFVHVDTPESLDQMINDIISLKDNDSDIAIDLEHHNYRSFMGFTCLIQLSTRYKDYIIDSLEVRSELYKLNIVTADPSRIKVFHGAESDIEWLQRDFGVYVVGLFDTYHATKILNYPKHSLAYLLQTIPKVNSDKKYQLADWRIRPLTADMLNYARADTHYLLEIFDVLRKELMSVDNGLNNVINKSKTTALRIFEKEYYDGIYGNGPNGWNTLLSKHTFALNNKQLVVFKALHAWRDQIARLHDESIRYVLPNHILFSISSRLPDSVEKLLAACIPTPPLIRLYSREVLELIEDSLLNVQDEDSLNTLETDINSEESSGFLISKHFVSPIYPIPRFPAIISTDNINSNSMDIDNLEQSELDELKDISESENLNLKSYLSGLFKDSMDPLIVSNGEQIETLLKSIKSISSPLFEFNSSLNIDSHFPVEQEPEDESIPTLNETDTTCDINNVDENLSKEINLPADQKTSLLPKAGKNKVTKKDDTNGSIQEDFESAAMDVNELVKDNSEILVISQISSNNLSKNKRKHSNTINDNSSANIIKLDSDNNATVELNENTPPTKKNKKNRKKKAKGKTNVDSIDIDSVNSTEKSPNATVSANTVNIGQNSLADAHTKAESNPDPNAQLKSASTSEVISANPKGSKKASVTKTPTRNNKPKPYDPFAKTVFKSDFKTIEQNETANEDFVGSDSKNKDKQSNSRVLRSARKNSGNKSMTFSKKK